MHTITWENVVGLAGEGYFGDIVIESGAGTSRGPIESVRLVTPGSDDIDGRTRVVVSTVWMAAKPQGQSPWQNKRTREAQTIVTVISATLVPKILDGSVVLSDPNVGTITLLSKMAPNASLDPKRVCGLNQAEFRKSLAQRYNLPLYTPWEHVLEHVSDTAERIRLRYSMAHLATL